MSIVLDGTTGLAGAATGALNGTLGATTPSTVVATTISASGAITGTNSANTVSLAGASGYGTLTGDATPTSASGIVYINANSRGGSTGSTTANGAINLTTNESVFFSYNNGTVKATIDPSGNVGIGVTPFTNTLSKSLDMVNGVGLFGYNAATYLSSNAYFDTSWKYKASSNNAARYSQDAGTHVWSTASVGTAGNAITFTQAMTLDASSNLSVAGTISAASYLTSTNTETLRVLSGKEISFGNNTASLGIGMYFDGTSKLISYARTGGAALMSLNTNGAIQLVSNIGVGNATPSTSGAGITFPATQSASTDANTLDDYEEGTWTITATPSTSGTLTASANKTGAYTKVGRTVAVTGFFGITSVSSPVGTSVNISLPFTIATLTEQAARIGTVVNSYNGVTQTTLPCIGIQGDAYIRVTVTASSLSAGQDFGFTFSFITA